MQSQIPCETEPCESSIDIVMHIASVESKSVSGAKQVPPTTGFLQNITGENIQHVNLHK